MRGSGIPSVDDFVQAYLEHLRAPHKKKYVSTSAGHIRIDQGGERTILGPDGSPIRIVEHPTSSTQIEANDSLHAVVRPTAVSNKAR